MRYLYVVVHRNVFSDVYMETSQKDCVHTIFTCAVMNSVKAHSKVMKTQASSTSIENRLHCVAHSIFNLY